LTTGKTPALVSDKKYGERQCFTIMSVKFHAAFCRQSVHKMERTFKKVATNNIKVITLQTLMIVGVSAHCEQ
jgi:hypothetical protein